MSRLGDLADPDEPLQPGLTYRVQLHPALVGWAGESLDTTQTGWTVTPAGDLRWFSEFTIAGSPVDDPPEQLEALGPGPTLTELFEPGQPFDPERAACGCHQTAGELAQARLDLSDPQTAWTGLVLRTGLEPTGFPMVTPRRPAESYLIHKLLRTAAGDELHGVHGEAMPPMGPASHADMSRITPLDLRRRRALGLLVQRSTSRWSRPTVLSIDSSLRTSSSVLAMRLSSSPVSTPNSRALCSCSRAILVLSRQRATSAASMVFCELAESQSGLQSPRSASPSSRRPWSR